MRQKPDTGSTPSAGQTAVARAVAGAPKAGRPKTSPQHPSATRGQVQSIDSNGVPWITIGGSDTLVPATISHAPTGLQAGDVVDVQTVGTRILVTGRASAPAADTALNFPTYYGPFDPNGYQSGTTGDTYMEESQTTPGLWRKTTVGGNTGWVQMGGVPSAISFYVGHTYAVSGLVNPPGGGGIVGYLPPFVVPILPGQTMKLIGVWHKLRAGTAAISISEPGSGVFFTISVTSTLTYTTWLGSPFSMSDGNELQPLCSTSSGADGLTITFVMEVGIG